MEDAVFASALFALFDRQRFEENGRLAALLRDTEVRCGDHALSDDALSFVSAAGEPMPHRPAPQDEGDGL